jgi:hypothetical protein
MHNAKRLLYQERVSDAALLPVSDWAICNEDTSDYPANAAGPGTDEAHVSVTRGSTHAQHGREVSSSRRLVARKRTLAQAVVEFGIVALLFTLLVFATIDFGLLLNTWISVSSASRELARSAAVGKQQAFLKDEASRLNLPSVNAHGGSVCCDANSAIEIKVEYFNHLAPTCAPPATPAGCPVARGTVYRLYPSPLNFDQLGTCTQAPSPLPSSCHPQSDDWVTVTVTALGAEVITPLVRPFFGCTDGSKPICAVPVSSSTTMRFEGGEF